MKTNKKYVMIVTEEDDRYDGRHYDCGFYANAPWEGNLSDIVYGDNVDELRIGSDAKDNEGLFYMLYSTSDGRRIGSGTIGFDAIEEEIIDYEETVFSKVNTTWSVQDIMDTLEENGIDWSGKNIGKVITSEFIKTFHDRIVEFGNEMLNEQVKEIFKEKGN